IGFVLQIARKDVRLRPRGAYSSACRTRYQGRSPLLAHSFTAVSPRGESLSRGGHAHHGRRSTRRGGSNRKARGVAALKERGNHWRFILCHPKETTYASSRQDFHATR